MALHCCECGVKLAKSTAKFCPKGHPQFDTPKTKQTQSKTKTKTKVPPERYNSPSEGSGSDDRDPSDTEMGVIVMDSAKDWMPSEQSERQKQGVADAARKILKRLEGPAESASTTQAEAYVEELIPSINCLRKRTRRTDAEDKKDKAGGK